MKSRDFKSNNFFADIKSLASFCSTLTDITFYRNDFKLQKKSAGCLNKKKLKSRDFKAKIFLFPIFAEFG